MKFHAFLFRSCAAAWISLFGHAFAAQQFQLPTANHALFEKDGGEKFLVGTVGHPWTSGSFGCVRSGGWQIHEGLDIRCLQRDKRGEPTDPVTAAADGTVAYLNRKPSLSNYGNYILLRHVIDGVEIYSLYAHLSEIRNDLNSGSSVKSGDVIATMGRTSNTREGISKDRAHVHFELDLFYNDAFEGWFRKTYPKQRNDHGMWNGQNLVAIDPRAILLEQQRLGAKFNLLEFLKNQTELFRVVVRDTNFPWLRRYAALVKPNPRSESEGISGYEIAFNFNGVPFELTPRAASEIKGKTKFQLLSVNEVEQRKNPARRFVTQRRGRWELATRGINLLELLTYNR